MSEHNTSTISRERAAPTAHPELSGEKKVPFIRPLALLLGAMIGFAGCSIAGYVTTLKNQYGKSFTRFGQQISPEASFYPTIKQMVAIARSKARKDQILVVIGGDSVFNGCGQPEQKVWSNRLQEMLGDRYAVVNFAMRGGSVDTAGVIAATALSKEYKKTIFIASSWPEYFFNPRFSQYEYLYWDALYKGMLDNFPQREATERSRTASSDEREKRLREELSIHKMADSIFYFDDLWTTIGYQKFFTVWNANTKDGFTKPRRKFPDIEAEPAPLATRFMFNHDEMRYLNNTATRFVKRDANGNWVSKPGAWSKLEQSANSISPTIRKQSVIALMRACPAYVQRLTTVDQEADAVSYGLCAQKWQDAGFNSTTIGADFSPEDYSDPRHLSPAGGEKLAEIMSRHVVSLADSLGYNSDAK